MYTVLTSLQWSERMCEPNTDSLYLPSLSWNSTRGIAGFISPLLDETILAISEAFKPTAGSSEQKSQFKQEPDSHSSASKSLTTFHDFTYLVARIAGRVMVGKDLCRNDDYEHAIVQFA